MIKTDSRRKSIRIITYVVALIFCLSVSTITLFAKSQNYEYTLKAKQQNAVVELSECVDAISTELNKGIYAGTPPMLSSIATELSKNCSCAKTALAQISASNTFLENTYKFLSQVGDFTISLSKKSDTGGTISGDERAQLYSLLDYSKALSDNISRLQSEYDAGTNMSIQSETINTSLSDIEQSFSSYPSLIYDGPFSDHMNQEDAEMLNGLEEIDKETARELAAKYTGLEKDALLAGNDETSVFDSYTFSTESTSISITKKGGYLCYLLSSNRAGEAKLNCDEAVKIGKKYLSDIGYPSMVETYYSVEDGVCTINYAYSIGDIVCYTDLCKVGVSLDNGRILTMDARGYLMNHIQRNLLEPTLSATEAEKSLSPNLTVKNVKRALIPTDSGKEYLCYEFLCRSDRDEDVLVYVDAFGSYERQILLLLYSDQGTLTK